MKEVKIVQLSDLHLGSDLVLRALKQGRFRWWKNANDKLLIGLRRALATIKPDYVLITGDIVNKCTTATLTDAARTLRDLLTDAGVNINEQVLVIPGNHDVKVFPEEDEIFGRLKDFVYFLKAFFNESSYRTRTERFVRVDSAAKVSFFCLDSTLKEERPVAHGRIGQAQWQWLERKHRDLQAGYVDYDLHVKVVALHHHPHAIEEAPGDLGMQLDDAGTAISTFQSMGANVVLHGHKHYPHHLVHSYGLNGREEHYTVIGAGTATCPWPDEQAGRGNSFNALTIRPAVNQLELERYQADGDGVFRAGKVPLLLELFRPSGAGYRSREFSLDVRVHDLAGTCTLTYRRLGLFVDTSSGYEFERMKFLMSDLPPDAEIVDFQVKSSLVTRVDYDVNDRREKRGFLVLEEPLRWGMEPIDLVCTYKLLKGIRLRKDATGVTHETVEMEVIHPCAQLTLTLELPQGLRLEPAAFAEDRNRIGEKLVWERDIPSNRYTLKARRPRELWTYGLRWELDTSA